MSGAKTVCQLTALLQVVILDCKKNSPAAVLLESGDIKLGDVLVSVDGKQVGLLCLFFKTFSS